jgi:hypothetical protein
MLCVGAAERRDLLIGDFKKDQKIAAFRSYCRGKRSDDMKKVMSVWFFCHLQMVTFARSSVLLRLKVAPSRSFTPKKRSCLRA